MLNDNEEEELSALIDEMGRSDFERRKRRMLAAQTRIEEAAKFEGRTGAGFAQMLAKVRKGEPLSDDEFVWTHLGFTRKEWSSGEPMRELQRRKVGPFAASRAVNTKAESN
jgi:hypothetical protein